MKRYSAVVVDDETLARKRIRRLLGGEPDIDVVGECADGKEALAMLNRKVPDMVFLDIQMPEMDGFSVLRALAPKRVPAIVFVSAYDEYALQAFEVNALDYLLKPFDNKRFQETVARARERLAVPTTAISDRLEALLETMSAGNGNRGRIAVKSNGKVMFVNTTDIDWIEAVTGHTAFVRRSHGSSRRDLSNCSASEVHRDVNERDRILTCVGAGSIPERGKAS